MPYKIYLAAIPLETIPLGLISEVQKLAFQNVLMAAIHQFNEEWDKESFFSRSRWFGYLEYAIRIAALHQILSDKDELIICDPSPKTYAEKLVRDCSTNLAELFLRGLPISLYIEECMKTDCLRPLVKNQVRELFYCSEIQSLSLQELWMARFPIGSLTQSCFTAEEIINLEESGWRFVIKHFSESLEPSIRFRFKFINQNGHWSHHDYNEEIEIDSYLGKKLLSFRPWQEWVHRIWENDGERTLDASEL